MSKRDKATKAKPYTGILNEPMPLPRETLLSRTLEEQRLQTTTAILHRIAELFHHYDIDPKKDSAWMLLAASLAFNHVPGFHFGEKKPGAPYKRLDDDIRIYFGVKKLLAEDKTINNACLIIENRGVVKGLKASSIRQRYYGFVKEGKVGWHIDRMMDQVSNVIGSEAAKDLFK